MSHSIIFFSVLVLNSITFYWTFYFTFSALLHMYFAFLCIVECSNFLWLCINNQFLKKYELTLLMFFLLLYMFICVYWKMELFWARWHQIYTYTNTKMIKIMKIARQWTNFIFCIEYYETLWCNLHFRLFRINCVEQGKWSIL